ncbi:MAG: ATP-binding protein [Planctomycetaceae bacterium]|nr:ATP-binding protein [Planctomycetaceae bacterium]
MNDDSRISSGEDRLLDLLPVGAFLIREDFVVVRWNRTVEEWTGMTAADAVGQPLTDLFPNVADGRYAERLRQVFSTGMPATYSPAFHKHFLPVPARHGLEDQLMVQQTEVRLFSREPALALVTIADVSLQYVQLGLLRAERAELVKTRDELKAAVQGLEASNRELDDFNYIASHDLQEPLRKIVSFSALLEKQCAEQLPDSGIQYLGFMSDAARRMKNLISDLLSLSRTSRAQLEPAELDLNQCVDDVLQLLGHRLESTGAQLQVPALPAVSGDRRLIAQLYQNLIGNALKFVTDETPRVELTAERGEGEWILGVLDNGIGISEDAAARIFQPFQRLHGRDEYEGTGIGLSICRKAVQRHNGRIWVESRPGEGAHFRFTLPDRPATGTAADLG